MTDRMRRSTGRPIARPLLAWYRQYRRDLPWRRTRDPYAIWLSETMLQQTQVATVGPYYRRFLARFPTVAALAAAPLDEVLRLWAGLGYYARARNLHAAARRVVAEHDGRLPDSVDALRRLPGVGRYTAGAVASIAFGRRAAAVDGNAVRVLARLFAWPGDPRTPRLRERIWRAAEEMLPRPGPTGMDPNANPCGDVNQALMELGATVCTPTAPDCPRCPLRHVCRARALGRADRIPGTARRPTVQTERLVVAAVERGGRWLLVRRPPRGRWGGLWELPTAPLDGRPSSPAARRLLANVGCRAVSVDPRPICELRCRLTHRDITFVIHRCRASGRAGVPRGHWRRLDDLHDLALSTAAARIVAALAERGRPMRAGSRPAKTPV